MSWIDIGIIALIVLLGLLGVLKGFKKSLLALGAFLVSFILAFFLANVIAEALLGIDGVKNFVLGNGFGEGADFSLANAVYTMNTNGSNVISDFLIKNFKAPIEAIIAKSTTTGIDPAYGYAMYTAFLMLSALCGVGIFIIVRFLLCIVTVIVKSYIGKKKSPVSRLAGFLLGAVRGALWAFAITLVFSAFGGHTFIVGVNSIEDEYEHKNAVFCQYFNSAAYYIRNNLFLPNADMYGRIVETVFKLDTGDDNIDFEQLEGEQLRLYINLKNLNYEYTGEENAPWYVDDDHKRAFDENIANAYRASEFESVGFDKVMQAIFDFNESAAAVVDTPEFADNDMVAYNDFVYDNTTSVAKRLVELIDKLREYIADFNYGKTLTETSEIALWNNTRLSNDYNQIKALLNNIAEQYSFAPNLGTFPDLTDIIPARVNAGPQTETPPAEDGKDEGEQGGDENGDNAGENGDGENETEQSSPSLEALRRTLMPALA